MPFRSEEARIQASGSSLPKFGPDPVPVSGTQILAGDLTISETLNVNATLYRNWSTTIRRWIFGALDPARDSLGCHANGLRQLTSATNDVDCSKDWVHTDQRKALLAFRQPLVAHGKALLNSPMAKSVKPEQSSVTIQERITYAVAHGLIHSDKRQSAVVFQVPNAYLWEVSIKLIEAVRPDRNNFKDQMELPVG